MWTSKSSFYLITDNERLKDVFKDSRIGYTLKDSFWDIKNSFVVAELLYFKEHELYELAKNNLFVIIISQNAPVNLSVLSNVVFMEKRYFMDNTGFFLEFIRKIFNKLMDLTAELENLEDKLFHIAMSSTDILEKNEEYSRLISVDGLTGLFNHSHFQTKMLEAFENYKRKNDIFSVAMLDLDFFKKVNDTYGHIKGDEVLKRFADIIRSTIRKEDFPARYGGEEFVILFNEGAKVAGEILERLRKKFSAEDFEKDGDFFHVTFSAGVSEISSKHTNPQMLIKDADTALYFSKRSGRNRITISDD